MCAGDVALEPHAPTDGPDNGPLDGGWNGIHGTSPLSPLWRHAVGMHLLVYKYMRAGLELTLLSHSMQRLSPGDRLSGT